jgi:hypothetical protein
MEVTLFLQQLLPRVEVLDRETLAVLVAVVLLTETQALLVQEHLLKDLMAVTEQIRLAEALEPIAVAVAVVLVLLAELL